MTKMIGKPANRWLDVQIVIASLGMAFSLFLWNIFAGGSQSTTQPVSTGSTNLAPTTQVDLVPTQAAPHSSGTVLLGGSAPVVQPVVPVQPAPVTHTGSSRP